MYDGDDGDVVVSAVNPERLIGVTDDLDLEPIGEDAHNRFKRALEAL